MLGLIYGLVVASVKSALTLAAETTKATPAYAKDALPIAIGTFAATAGTLGALKLFGIV